MALHIKRCDNGRRHFVTDNVTEDKSFFIIIIVIVLIVIVVWIEITTVLNNDQNILNF